MGQSLWSWDLKSDPFKWQAPEVVGCVALRSDGGLLLGMQSGLYGMEGFGENLQGSWTVTARKLTEFEPGMDTRPNDGRVDRAGNFVVGSYNMAHRQVRGFPWGTSEGQVPVFACSRPSLCPFAYLQALSHGMARRCTSPHSLPTLIRACTPLQSKPPASPCVNTQDGKEIGGLWRYTPDGRLHEILDHKVRCSNCVCFSPDGNTM